MTTIYRHQAILEEAEMDEKSIVQKYRQFMSEIELNYSDRDVPLPLQSYYLLATLISLQSLTRFQRSFGALPIDETYAAIGKEEYLGRGLLSDFEIETCFLWNKFCSDAKRNQNARAVQSINY